VGAFGRKWNTTTFNVILHILWVGSGAPPLLLAPRPGLQVSKNQINYSGAKRTITTLILDDSSIGTIDVESILEWSIFSVLLDTVSNGVFGDSKSEHLSYSTSCEGYSMHMKALTRIRLIWLFCINQNLSKNIWKEIIIKWITNHLKIRSILTKPTNQHLNQSSIH
jgi:hypothetical protein